MGVAQVDIVVRGARSDRRLNGCISGIMATIVAPNVSMVADGSMTMDGMMMTAGVDGGH